MMEDQLTEEKKEIMDMLAEMFEPQISWFDLFVIEIPALLMYGLVFGIIIKALIRIWMWV